MDNEAHSLFEKFLQGKTCRETLSLFQELCRLLCLDPTDYRSFYHKLKGSLNYWKAKALWAKLDKRAAHKDYEQGQACVNTKCLVLGSGPCGLRTAIELAFLGAKVFVVEKRDDFSRNNVLHLWPFTIHDLRALGAKKFYGKFCSGSLDHISIRQLQLILLKVALILGVEIHVNVEYKGLIEPPKDKGTGWRAHLLPAGHPVSDYEFDVFVSAGGGKYVPEGFKKKEMRGKLAIGITANFVNNHSTAEAKVQEISGVAYLYNQKFFQQLHKETGIDLENIVYYKDDTHYFVMTARKQSLLKYGVIHEDKQDAGSLLSAHNVNSDSLLRYAHQAANFSTKQQLPNLEFATNHQGKPDVAMFDFTCMYRSENSALVKERHGRRLLIALVGDCLVEPFWPLGTGIARGFLAAFDAAWLVRKWGKGIAPVELLAERESIYQLLSQTTPENTNKNISQYSIDPLTRYPHVNLSYFKPNQVQHLYDTGQTTDLENKTSQPKGKMLRNDSGTGYEELLNWFQVLTEGYKNVKVVDLTASWKSGLALCALIHHFRPDLIDFESLKEESVAENNQLAFNIAENEFGISPIMTGREMATLASPDKLSMVMYLTQFNEFFKNLPPGHQGSSKKTMMSLASAKSALMFLSSLRKSVANKRSSVEKTDFDTDKKRQKAEAEHGTLSTEDPNMSLVRQKAIDSPWTENSKEQNEHPEKSIETTGEVKRQGSFRQVEGPSSSEVCYLCKKRVYVVERCSAEGHFFHRGCFTCHQCGTTLRLGNYAFDSRDGKFYCTVHDTSSLSSNEKNEAESASTASKDVLDGEMEWCIALEKIGDGEEDIDEGLQDLGEIENQWDEENKLTEKGPFECTEHSRVPVMRHLASPGRNPSPDMDQAFVSQSMVDHQRSDHESSSNSSLAAGSGRNSMDYKNNVESANAEYKHHCEECSPSATQSTATTYLTGTNNIPSSSFEPVLDDSVRPAGNKTKINAERVDISKTKQNSTSDKIIKANLEFPESFTPESLPSHPSKPLHMDNVNGTINTVNCKEASTNEYQSCIASPGVNSVNIKVSVEDTVRESESSCLPTELSSLNFDFKLAMDEEKDNGTVPKKRLTLSPSIRRKLTRLSVTSESESDGQDDDTLHVIRSDDKLPSGSSRLLPSTCISAEFQDSGREREMPSNSSSTPRIGNSRSIEEQERSQAYWDMLGPNSNDKSHPNATQPLCANNQLEVPKDKTMGEFAQDDKPNEKDSGSETSKFKIPHFSKMFSRISKREKKTKEPVNVTQLPKPEISIAQVSSVSQEEVKSCILNDDEELHEDEEESVSEDELEYSTEPLLKAKPSPEEAAARRETWRRRTIERRAKQEEMARLLKAQMIQRRLEEIEQMYHELEQKGILLEEEMRKGAGDQPQMMQSWFTLVQDKNKLLNEESELMISGRELELQDQKSRLDQELRRYMSMNASEKSKEDHLEEERIFKEMIEVVRMRDKLVTFLEQQRLQELEQHAIVVPGAAAKDLSLNDFLKFRLSRSVASCTGIPG
ncbi:F-actin-monooxygenase mical1-like isoform X2 [Pristis pectinata]|uniref:F-actin-monooxygenase mical1-like isoform X2 n=1 Tax=Pristis pectinata TaxID=685728 RepID=UPI00223D9E9B|nr:F-actin-monooxygenase mical1-like isoform X2 [Pristis pectinata]